MAISPSGSRRAYGLAYVLFGRLVDRVGARIGYVLAVTLWTVGHVAHVLVTTTPGWRSRACRWRSARRAPSPPRSPRRPSGSPSRERALAIGIFNAGANVGAIVTPLVVPVIAVTFGWRMAFVATGLLTVLWLVAWLGFYRRPREHPRVTPAELACIECEPADPAASDRVAHAAQPAPDLGLYARPLPDRSGVVDLPVLAARLLQPAIST